jgi:hypothetical protein
MDPDKQQQSRGQCIQSSSEQSRGTLLSPLKSVHGNLRPHTFVSWSVSRRQPLKQEKTIAGAAPLNSKNEAHYKDASGPCEPCTCVRALAWEHQHTRHQRKALRRKDQTRDYNCDTVLCFRVQEDVSTFLWFSERHGSCTINLLV